ncbi:MAG: TonB family protein, partial [Gallionellaceae bacterium]|nr:TonB family protein [Gallionellaceae bacterium]
AIELSLNPFMAMSYAYSSRPERSPLHERITAVALVVMLHALVFASWLLQPEAPAVLVNEMSISFANVQMQQADITPQPKPKPREPDPLPADEPAKQEEVQPVQQDVTPPSPIVLDAEPDYRADYLNNPKPPYPMVARRMGYHGKVVLNVEVLAEGRAGEVQLHQTCGYDILDNAAIQTVKTWRFLPARRFGQPVTQWFLVPIKFSLEGDEA